MNVEIYSEAGCELLRSGGVLEHTLGYLIQACKAIRWNVT